ncbi:acylphosphatase [Frateuria sp. STR12]|uniref:acylphosphatase n=1 Tax=Frateuria hangzhouensis TaxID=2995589 RepID=UPI002260CB75|nr:acylphosphatase [Frateuria sp. STR12]MCX7513893.1 acylphosphatase [Frateuria sp. STR12]
MAAARFLVSGVVQGVFFRASTREQAQRLGLTGHARNLADGRVEVIAHGAPAALDALEQWLWQGPPAAQVAAVQRGVVEGEAPGGFSTG